MERMKLCLILTVLYTVSFMLPSDTISTIVAFVVWIAFWIWFDRAYISRTEIEKIIDQYEDKK